MPDHDDSRPARVPKVLVTKTKDSVALDLPSRLLLDRIVFLGSDIDNTVANAVD